MIGKILVAAGLIFSADLAHADSDTLLPITFASLSERSQKGPNGGRC
jgi:hypothetical protein